MTTAREDGTGEVMEVVGIARDHRFAIAGHRGITRLLVVRIEPKVEGLLSPTGGGLREATQP